MEFFISTLVLRISNKFQNIKHFWVVLMSFKDIKWMKDIFGIFISIFCKNYLINSAISSIFGWVFLHFKDLVNEGQILNFYKHFIYKNFMMNFKMPGFVGLAGWICNLDFIKVTRTQVEKMKNVWDF